MASTDSMTGPELEARALRLYLAQGTFAERGLLPTATADRRMLATDIDVLVSEYTSGFHLTRRHLECKTGKIALLDRILWLSGVRTLLHADSTYLVASDIDFGASEFAARLDVQLFSIQNIEAWEKSLAIPAAAWPCRSDYQTFDPAKAAWQRLSGRQDADDDWRLFREALAFVEVESWLTFRYRLLNKLLRLLGDVTQRGPQIARDRDKELCARYIISALLVRLSQYILAICADVANVPATELERHLTQRLAFGDQDPAQAGSLVQQTVTWISRALAASGGSLPAEIDIGRLTAPPPFAADLIELVRKVLDNSHEARYLPLAMERLQFGAEADDLLPRFRAAAQFADTLAAHVRAFAVRAFAIPENLVKPPHADLSAVYRGAGAAPAAAAPAGPQAPAARPDRPGFTRRGRRR